MCFILPIRRGQAVPDAMSSSPHRLVTDDTSTDAEAVLVAGYRRMTAAQKLERVRQLTRAVQELALRDIQRRHPGASARDPVASGVALAQG